MRLEKGIFQKEKVVRTKAYGTKKGICLGSSSDRAPTERNGQTGNGVKPDRKWS